MFQKTKTEVFAEEQLKAKSQSKDSEEGKN